MMLRTGAEAEGDAMVAKLTMGSRPGTETYSGPREHQSFRLDPRHTTILEDVCRGVEEGDAGLKSCAPAHFDAKLGVSKSDANAMFRATEVEDEDECFDKIGAMLANGFSFAEVSNTISLGGGSTHMLALERYCARIGLTCDADQVPAAWSGSALHERRRRARRTLKALWSEPGGGVHASVLHVVYGWPDPFVGTLPVEIQVAFGRELAPLVRYTDAVETRRQAMVWRETVRKATRSDGTIDLNDQRERSERLNRILSSGDALRDGIKAPRHRDMVNETKEQYREHVLNPHKAALTIFIASATVDANRMLTAASVAYRDAWFRS